MREPYFHKHRDSKGCYKYILFFVNFLFWLAGLFFLVIGVIAYIDSGGIAKSSTPNPIHLIFNLTVLCIGVGVIVVIISFAGWIGALRENTCLLKFYKGFLILIFLAECVLTILFFVYRSKVIGELEQLMRTAFIQQYREPGFDDTTNLIDTLQKQLQCCGTESYKDWDVNRYFSCNASNRSPEACGVPYSCCRTMNNINKAVINTMCGYGVQKLSYPHASSKVWAVGCVQGAVNFVERNIIPVSSTFIGIAVLQILAIVMARNLAGYVTDELRLLALIRPPTDRM